MEGPQAAVAADNNGPQIGGETAILGKPLWRNRTFGMLLTGNAVAVFGDCFSGIAISLWVLQETGSAKLMAAVLICHMTVSVLFGSIAGTAADRFNRRKLMACSDMLRCGIAAALALCLYTLDAPFAVMLGLVALSAFAGLFHGPAFHASVTQVAGKPNVGQATSAIYLMDNVARITGLALAGVAIAAFGGWWAMMINSGTFLFSALCVLAAGRLPRVASSGPAGSKPFLQELLLGFVYIKQDALTRAVVILNPLLVLLFMASHMLIQVLAIQEWKAGPAAFGLIEMCVPLGYLAGAGIIMAFASRMGRRGWWVFMGMITLGPVFILIAYSTDAIGALPFILLGGLLFAFSSMMTQIILRSEIRDEMQGRVYGTLGAITGIAPSVGLILSSALADRLGAQAVLGGQGVCLFVFGIAAAVLLKSIRNYD